jgi:hypothetical protein
MIVTIRGVGTRIRRPTNVYRRFCVVLLVRLEGRHAMRCASFIGDCLVTAVYVHVAALGDPGSKGDFRFAFLVLRLSPVVGCVAQDDLFWSGSPRVR